MTTQTQKPQLALNRNGFGSMNVILNGELLFCSKHPNVADIVDAFGIDATNGVSVMVDGLYQEDYVKKFEPKAEVAPKVKTETTTTPITTTIEAKQLSEAEILAGISSVTFKTNSEKLLKDAGIISLFQSDSKDEDEEDEDEPNEYKTPTAGEKIYVPAMPGALSRLHGGSGIVEEVRNTDSGIYVALVGIPNLIFLWDEIAEYQEAMAHEFGDTVAVFVGL